MYQMLWLYNFIVSFEGFTFPHQFPRIHWIHRHFVTTIIGSIWSTHVYWQAQCANGNSIVQYLHPSRLHTSCPETRLPDQYTPFYFTNLSTDNLTIHYQGILTDEAIHERNPIHTICTSIDKDMTPLTYPSIVMLLIYLIIPVFLLVLCNMTALYSKVRAPDLNVSSIQ